MVVEEVLHSVFESSSDMKIKCLDDLVTQLNARSQRSKTTKLWVENLIKAVIFMMTFSRGVHVSHDTAPGSS